MVYEAKDWAYWTSVGKKTVGLVHNGQRPTHVIMNRVDIQALMDDPRFLKVIRDTLARTD